MPAKQQRSGLMAKYGNRLGQIVQSHAADAVDYGFQRLPPGITNGIAKLTDCYFAQYKSGNMKDEYYFRAVGVVVEPKEVTVDGRPMAVQGMQTSYMEPVCQTQTQAGKVTTQDEHVTSIMNEMKKLGADFSETDDLELVAAALKEAGPYFKFSTSVRQPMPGTNNPPGVWENWYGSKGLEEYTPPEDADAVDDNTAAAAPAPKPNGTHAGPRQTAGKETPARRRPEPQPEPEGDPIDQLVERANAGEEEAADELKRLATEAGHPEEAVDVAKSWDDVGELARSPAEESTEAVAEAVEQQEEVTKDRVYRYFPETKGPGGKPVKAKKAIDVEPVKIDKRARTADVKSLQDGKTVYKAVPWADLE